MFCRTGPSYKNNKKQQQQKQKKQKTKKGWGGGGVGGREKVITLGNADVYCHGPLDNRLYPSFRPPHPFSRPLHVSARMKPLTKINASFQNPEFIEPVKKKKKKGCLLYTSPSPRDMYKSRMPSSA